MWKTQRKTAGGAAMNQRRKLKGWRGCGHTPNEDRDFVFEHVSGVRASAMLAVFPDGSTGSANHWPESGEIDRCVKIQGGRPLRGMMMWAAK